MSNKTIDHVFETFLMVENRKSICLFNMYFKYEVCLHQVFIMPSWTVLTCCSKLFLYLKSSSHSEQVLNFSFFSCKRQIHITTMCGNSRIFEILQSNKVQELIQWKEFYEKKFSYCPKCGIMLKHNIILGKNEGVMKKKLDAKSVWKVDYLF